MGWESFDVVSFFLGPSFKVKRGYPNLKVLFNLLIIDPRGLQCETNLYEIIGWESFDVFRFDLGPLLQGQTRIGKFKRCC